LATRDPDSSIGYLLTDVARLLRRDFDRRVRDLNLTQVQWRAIAHLEREEGMNQATLAERLEVKPITLARLVDRLEGAGWVKRKADASDRRASRLFLTPQVRPILKQMRARAEEALGDMLAGIPAASQRELIAALQRMKQNLSDSAGVTGHTGVAAAEGRDRKYGRRKG